jgi:hypothetical protein
LQRALFQSKNQENVEVFSMSWDHLRSQGLQKLIIAAAAAVTTKPRHCVVQPQVVFLHSPNKHSCLPIKKA